MPLNARAYASQNPTVHDGEFCVPSLLKPYETQQPRTLQGAESAAENIQARVPMAATRVKAARDRYPTSPSSSTRP